MKITIRGGHVDTGGQLITVPKFCSKIAEGCVSGLRDEPLPDNVRWISECGNWATYILELQPELRVLSFDMGYWADIDDDEVWHTTHSGTYTLATPYVVIAALFNGNSIQSANVFYRTAPLKILDDQLLQANLPNLLYDGAMCLDGVKHKRHCTHGEALDELVNHLWSGEFNSDMGNNLQAFAESKRDERLANLDAWSEASKKDPKFVLGVNWLPCPVKWTPRRLLTERYCGTPGSSNTLANLLLATK